MKVKVNIYGNLRKTSRFNNKKDNIVTISSALTIKEFLEQENIPVNKAFVLINDKNKNKEFDYKIKENDEVTIYPVNIGG